MLRKLLRSPLLAAALLIPGTLHATQNVATPAVARPCSDQEDGFPSCGISSEDRQKADGLYRQAAKLARHGQFDQALEKLKAAREISPQDTIYAAAEQAVREKVAAAQVRQGDQAMQKGDATSAIASFQRALELDPANSYAEQRLHDAMPAPPRSDEDALYAEMGAVRLEPTLGVHNFEFRGSSTAALEKFAALFGITTVPDEGLIPRNVRISLDNVDWETGSQLLQKVCKVFLVPLSQHQVLVANNTEKNRLDLTRMGLRTFYFQGGSTPQQLTEVTAALRVLFELRYITPNPASGTIVIRAPQPTLDAVARFLDDLQDDQPTVMLEIQVFEVSTDFTKDVGVSVPDQFTVFNVPSEIQSLVTGSSYQQIIAALESAGQTVNATTILAALLSSSSSTSPLSQPFGTFGGGLTLTGVTIAASKLNFTGTNSLARTMDDILLRSEHGSPATLKVGERYPIVSSEFSATSAASNLLSSLGVSTPALSLTSAATTIPSPQFSYEDLGLVFKATPQIHGKLISLNYDLILRALGPIQSNGLPLLTNRESSGSISTGDGQSVVVAGLVDRGEVASLNGIPLLSDIPVLGKVFSVETPEKSADELLIVITPHVTSESSPHGIYIPVPMDAPK